MTTELENRIAQTLNVASEHVEPASDAWAQIMGRADHGSVRSARAKKWAWVLAPTLTLVIGVASVIALANDERRSPLQSANTPSTSAPTTSSPDGLLPEPTVSTLVVTAQDPTDVPVNLLVGESTALSIVGGAGNWTIKDAPNAAIATATGSSNGCPQGAVPPCPFSVRLAGVAQGSTTLTVIDAAEATRSFTVTVGPGVLPVPDGSTDPGSGTPADAPTSTSVGN